MSGDRIATSLVSKSRIRKILICLLSQLSHFIGYNRYTHIYMNSLLIMQTGIITHTHAHRHTQTGNHIKNVSFCPPCHLGDELSSG